MSGMGKPSSSDGDTRFAPAEANERPESYVSDDTSPESFEDRPSTSQSTVPNLIPIKATSNRPQLPGQTPSRRQYSEDELFRSLSRRTTRKEKDDGENEEMAEINRLLTEMFGRYRQENSEEEKTRHTGVIFKNLTVKGKGLGAAIQPTLANPLHFIKALITKGPKGAKRRAPERTLINGFTGCIRPGEMLLVLGSPGAGCSTFLKSLANQRAGYEEVLGEVTYGGTDWKTMAKKFQGDILYNGEDDLHYATLKVKNTLSFAIKTRTPGPSSRKEGESPADYVKEFLRVATKLFWIEHTLATKVGNEFIRGVSGGEKKRVSIAEALITKASTQMWDNSTRGLDASTAREYVEALRALTNMAHISTAAALYQLSENLFHFFDKVLLIDSGHCAYYGPTEQAGQYFKDLGFVQPDRWTTPDFLTSVADEHERHVRPGFEKRIPRTAAEFGDAFQRSRLAKQNEEDIKSFESELKQLIKTREANQTKATRQRNYTVPFYKQVLACTHRQALVMIGDPKSLVGKWAIILFQSLIVGSLFYNLPNTAAGVFPRGGVLFFMLLFNALLALAELTAAFESRPILLKHKSYRFYRPAAYAIAQTVIDVPLVFVQVFIFDVVVYWMSNLQRTASQFFISLLFLWIITMTMYGFFRAIGAITGSLDAATRITGVAVQALIVYTGYLIPPRKMKPWLSWLRYINPVAYGFEGLVVNEFYDLQIQCSPPYLVPLGPNAAPQFQSCTIQGSTPGSTVVSGERYVETAFSYSRNHLWRNFGIIIAFFIFFVFLTAIGLELAKPNKGSGDLTIFKRGQVPQTVQKAMEKGTVPADEESGKMEPTGYSEKEDEISSGSEDAGSSKALVKNETVFTWREVNYTIPYQGGSRKLLQHQQGYVRPARLTALMGSSGAGKTTLLNVLAQRINFGVVEGEFLVDGRPLPISFQRSSGFAEQMDVHEPTATVREALRFSAKLRQPREVPLQEKYDFVEDVIRLLEMENIAGAIVGTIGAGLNQEQRKRLTIGVELASKPELLMFLDEPTSGLDSAAAFNIVRLLKKLSAAGQAILCTIHQPSSVLFEYFDELILLEAGGRIVYHGELGHGSKTLISYLEKNGAYKCPPNANPAEYMLEAIGAGNPEYHGKDFGDVWDQSPERDARSREIEGMIQDRRNKSTENKTSDREYAMPLSVQIRSVVARRFVAYWRMPQYILSKFILHVMTGLFNCFTFYKLGNSQIDMQSRLFTVFLSLTIAPPLIQQLQPQYLSFRSLFNSRESKSKMYSWLPFTIAAVLVEIPYSLVAGTLYWACWYWGVNFHFSRGTGPSAIVWMFMMLYEVFYVGLGQAIASFAPNDVLASLLVPVFFTFIVSFCGVVVPPTGLPAFWRSWMYPLSPFHYLLEGMLGLITHDIPISYAGPFAKQAGGYVVDLAGGLCGYCQFATGDNFGASFNVYYSHHWRDFGIFWAYVIFNFAMVFLGSYVYLVGGRKFMQQISPKARKQRKAAAEKSQQEKS